MCINLTFLNKVIQQKINIILCRRCQCGDPTKDSQVDHILPVACWEGGVLADVGRFVRQPQVVEHNGGVFERRRGPLAHGGVLEAHTLFERGQNRYTQGRVSGGHVLLGAVYQLLPGDLRDLYWWLAVDEETAQLDRIAHKSRFTGVRLHRLPVTRCTEEERNRKRDVTMSSCTLLCI